MKLASGEELLTVKDIAERISFDGSEDGVARTLRQVRHWTQCDLLRTISEKNTGKGVPRFYEDEPSLLIAAILLELCRYGATVDILKPVADQLYEDWVEFGGMSMATAMTDLNAYLQVAWTADPVTGRFTGAQIHMFDELDQRNGEEDVGVEAQPSSSIVINMTRLTERIYGT